MARDPMSTKSDGCLIWPLIIIFAIVVAAFLPSCLMALPGVK